MTDKEPQDKRIAFAPPHSCRERMPGVVRGMPTEELEGLIEAVVCVPEQITAKVPVLLKEGHHMRVYRDLTQARLVLRLLDVDAAILDINPLRLELLELLRSHPGVHEHEGDLAPPFADTFKSGDLLVGQHFPLPAFLRILRFEISARIMIEPLHLHGIVEYLMTYGLDLDLLSRLTCVDALLHHRGLDAPDRLVLDRLKVFIGRMIVILTAFCEALLRFLITLLKGHVQSIKVEGIRVVIHQSLESFVPGAVISDDLKLLMIFLSIIVEFDLGSHTDPPRFATLPGHLMDRACSVRKSHSDSPPFSMISMYPAVIMPAGRATTAIPNRLDIMVIIRPAVVTG